MNEWVSQSTSLSNQEECPSCWIILSFGVSTFKIFHQTQRLTPMLTVRRHILVWRMQQNKNKSKVFTSLLISALGYFWRHDRCWFGYCKILSENWNDLLLLYLYLYVWIVIRTTTSLRYRASSHWCIGLFVYGVFVDCFVFGAWPFRADLIRFQLSLLFKID